MTACLSITKNKMNNTEFNDGEKDLLYSREDREAEIQRAVELAIVGSPALAKACYDEFDYALRLRTGEVIRFYSAEIISQAWIHISGVVIADVPASISLPYRADRGVDVRISDIVWVMDAPEGS